MISRGVIALGVLLVLAGLAWPWLGRVLGHLPGDLRIERFGFAVYFPLGSALLISLLFSVGVTLLAWFLRR
jgi:hypothetical protein